MILKRVYTSLINLGFERVGMNRDNISLYQYQHIGTGSIEVVAIYDCPTGLEYTFEQVDYIDEQISNYYNSKGYNKINLLGITATKNVENVKSIATNKNNFWIIDTRSYQLIIYENYNNEFELIKNQIQSILSEFKVASFNNSEIEVGNNEVNQVKLEYRKSFVSKYMSKNNTIIIIVNILVYLVVNVLSKESGKEHLMFSGALYWPQIIFEKEYYRLFTYMFLHANTSHLANNMLVLFFLGDNLERAAGRWKYLIMYFGSGIIAGLVSMSYNMFNGYNTISVGASGATFGIVGAMANIVIRNRGRLEDISTRQMVLFVFFSLYGGLTSQGIDNAAHIGGLISGFLLALILYRKPKKKKKTSR